MIRKSCWYYTNHLSHFFFAIDPSIRVNATGFMIFRLTRSNEVILLRLQLSTARVRDDKFDEVLRTSHQDSKYDFLYFDVPTQRYYQGFKYELCPPEKDEEKRRRKNKGSARLLSPFLKRTKSINSSKKSENFRNSR